MDSGIQPIEHAMKFPLRIFGAVQGLDVNKLDKILPSLGLPGFTRNGPDALDLEYEGPYQDIEPDLDILVAALTPRGQGHVDCIDHQDWEVRRYELHPGSWTRKRINPDGALESFHQE
jgi:hypothetical protein